MKECPACCCTLDDADRFCGKCGFALVGALEVSSEGTSSDQRVKWREKMRSLPFILVATFILLAGSAATYRVFAGHNEPGAALVRIAFDQIRNSAAEATPGQSPTPAISDAARAQPTTETDNLLDHANATLDGQGPGPSAVAAGAALLQPGKWLITTQLVNVAKVDPSDESFSLSRQGIGSSESSSICVTPAIAERPRAIAFPFQTGMACNPVSFEMTNGIYRSNMTCSFPQYGGRRPVDVSGRYSRTDLALDAAVKVPAKVVRGDFEQPPEILMQYRISGRMAGPC